MAFREVSVVQIEEVLRRWLRGDEGLRSIATSAGVDRKTVRRYVEAAAELGVVRDGGEGQLTDELLARCARRSGPPGPGGHGSSWEALVAEETQIKKWVAADLDRRISAILRRDA